MNWGYMDVWRLYVCFLWLFKRGQWPLGRIIELDPGEDGVVRVVTVQTSKGTYKRPAVKILRLENDGKFEVPQDGGNVR